VYRRTQRSWRLGQQLSFEHAFANPDERLGRVADVLVDWQDQLLGQRGRLNWQPG
jgi:hypothetical protein